MALTDTDFSIAANGDIREDAGTSTHEVIELHRWLMEKLANTATSGNDLLAVTNAIIPSVRRTDNIIELQPPYNISDQVSERFYNGSISQAGGDDLYSGLQVVGSVAGTTTLYIEQDDSVLANFWGDTDSALYADSANNILLRCLIKTRSGGVDIDSKSLRVHAREYGHTFANFSLTLGQGVSVAAIFTATDDFYVTASGTLDTNEATAVLTTGYLQRDADNDAVDENYWASLITDTLPSTQRAWETVKHRTKRGEVATIAGVAAQILRGPDVEIPYDTQDASEFFTEGEKVTFGNGAQGYILADTEAGVDAGATGTMWVQLVRGTAPANNDTIAGATCNALVNGTVTPRTTNANCVAGNFTGSFTGAYGFGWTNGELAETDRLTALDAVNRNPPNNITITVTDTASGDQVLLAATKTDTDTASGAHSIGDTALTLTTGVDADFDQVGRIVINSVEHVFTAHTGTAVTLAAPGLTITLSGGEATSITQFDNDAFTADTAAGVYNDTTDTVIQATAAITSGFPTAGSVYVWNTANGWYERYTYTGVSGQQLTGVSPALSRNISTEVMFIPYVDETSAGSDITKNIVYTADISARLRIYNDTANIVPFEVGVTIGSTGSSTPAIRNSDA